MRPGHSRPRPTMAPVRSGCCGRRRAAGGAAIGAGAGADRGLDLGDRDRAAPARPSGPATPARRPPGPLGAQPRAPRSGPRHRDWPDGGDPATGARRDGVGHPGVAGTDPADAIGVRQCATAGSWCPRRCPPSPGTNARAAGRPAETPASTCASSALDGRSVGPLLQAARDQRGRPRRQPLDRRQRLGLGVLVRAQQRGGGADVPGQLADQRAVDQQADRVHVGGRADLAALEPLRRQVGRRAQQAAVGVDVVLADQGRDAEVDDLGARGREHHVGRGDVAVHDAARMRGGQRGGDLGADPHGGRPGQPPYPGQHGGERLAVDQLHDHVRDGLTVDGGRLAVVVDVGDVRVTQPRGGLGLRTQPASERGIGAGRRRQDLHRDLSSEDLVEPSPHH